MRSPRSPRRRCCSRGNDFGQTDLKLPPGIVDAYDREPKTSTSIGLARRGTRRARRHPAVRSPRPTRRTFDRRRRRDAQASRQRGHGRQHAEGAGLGPRLSRGLVPTRHRKPPPLAGAGGAAVEIRRASPLRSGQAGRGSAARHACGGRKRPAGSRAAEGRRSARAGDRAPAADQLVDPHEMAGVDRRLLPHPR